MKTVGAGEFKARCLELMADVARSREVLLVTKRGKPLVELHAADAEGGDALESLRGSVLWQASDIVTWSVEDEWEAATD